MSGASGESDVDGPHGQQGGSANSASGGREQTAAGRGAAGGAARGGAAGRGSPPAGGGGREGTAGTAGHGETGGPVATTVVEALACAPSFTPMLDGPSAFRAPAVPIAAVGGDWDRDGKLDLAVASADGSVSVLLGNGDGSLALSGTYSTGTVTESPEPSGQLAAADLDGDGMLDLVTYSKETNAVNVLAGRRDGTFASAVTYPVDSPASLVIGDVDQDGALDVIVGGFNSVVLLPGLGDGSFDSPEVVFDRGALILGIGDLDEDGTPDLAVDSVLQGSYYVLALRGDGLRGFQPLNGTRSIGGAPMTVADFNHDGHLDVQTMIQCAKGTDEYVEVLLGVGDGTFTPASTYPAPCIWHGAVGDVDGDGNLDIVGSPTAVLAGKADGSFAPAAVELALLGGDALALGDWNGDGTLDVAAVTGNLIALRAGNRNDTFGGSASFAQSQSGTYLSSTALADLNDDGTLDLLTAGSDGSPDTTSTLSVLPGSTTGTFGAPVEIGTAVTPPAFIRLVDLNGDGILDLTAVSDGSISGGVVSVWLGSGHGNFGPGVAYVTAQNPEDIGAVDLDGDDRLDLVVVSREPATLSILAGNGDGSFAEARQQPLGLRPSSLAIADLDGDNVPELLVGGYDDAVVGVLSRSQNWQADTNHEYATAKYVSSIAVGDLNGDGIPDVVTANYDSLSVLLGTGGGAFGAHTDYSMSIDRVMVSDFDGDGNLDIITTGVDSQILFGAGDGTFACVARFALGALTQTVAVGDVNGDGRLDLLASASGALGSAAQGVYTFFNPGRRPD